MRKKHSLQAVPNKNKNKSPSQKEVSHYYFRSAEGTSTLFTYTVESHRDRSFRGFTTHNSFLVCRHFVVVASVVAAAVVACLFVCSEKVVWFVVVVVSSFLVFCLFWSLLRPTPNS